HAAEVGVVARPIAGSGEQGFIDFGVGVFGIPMVDGEVGLNAEALECAHHDGHPAVMDLAGGEVGGGMAGVAVGVVVLAGGDDDADFDGGVGGFHGLNVTGRAGGVSERIVRVGVAVGFPASVAFVADCPVGELVAGVPGMGDPGGGFGGRSGSIIDRDDGLGAEIGGDFGKGVEGSRPFPRVAVGSVAGPMVLVGFGAAGKTEEL